MLTDDDCTRDKLVDETARPKLVCAKTEGNGDCAFHALLGTLQHGQYYCPNVLSLRLKLKLTIISSQIDSTLRSYLITSIKALIMEGSKIGKHVGKLIKTYKKFTNIDNQLSLVRWSRFYKILILHDDIVDYINNLSPLGVKPTVNDFRSQFHDVLAHHELKEKILMNASLSKAFDDYNENDHFPWSAHINKDVILEYANYISKANQWLLPSDLAILAIIFNRTIIYYSSPSSIPEVINMGSYDRVIICFNGRDHYERAFNQDTLIPSHMSRASSSISIQDLPSESAWPQDNMQADRTIRANDRSGRETLIANSPVSAIELRKPVDGIALSNPLHRKLKRAVLRHINQFNGGDESLSCYVPLRGCLSGAVEHFYADLSSPIRQWIQDTQGKGNASSIVLTGLSGSGKTLFGQQLIVSLWNSDFANTTLPLWVPLLSIPTPTAKLVRRYIKLLKDLGCFEEDGGISESEIQTIIRSPICLVLDGYDELNTSANLYTLNSFDKNNNIQIIFTCRTEAMMKHVNNFGANTSEFKVLEYQLLSYQHDNNRSQIKDYIRKHVLYHRKLEVMRTKHDTSEPISYAIWGVDRYLKNIQALPELDELITNPFILSMVVKELPKIITAYEDDDMSGKRLMLTRSQIYTIFMTAWFDRRAKKLMETRDAMTLQAISLLTDEHKGLPLSEILANHARGLARDMFKHHVNEVSRVDAAWVDGGKKPWQGKWLDAPNLDITVQTIKMRLLRQNIPLTPIGLDIYVFLHSSILEFLAAKHLFMGALVHAWIRTNKNLNMFGLLEQPDMMNFMVDTVQQDKVFEDTLFQIIEMSKSEPSVWRAAANAASILNAANISLSGRDFSRVRLGGSEGWGANLSHAVLDGTKLCAADLRYVNFSGAYMVRADLTGACLDGARWGELPVRGFSQKSVGKIKAISMSMRWAITEVSAKKYIVYALIDDELIQQHIINRKTANEPIAIDEKLQLAVFGHSEHLSVYSLRNGKLLYKVEVAGTDVSSVIVPAYKEFTDERKLFFSNGYLIYIIPKPEKDAKNTFVRCEFLFIYKACESDGRLIFSQFIRKSHIVNLGFNGERQLVAMSNYLSLYIWKLKDHESKDVPFPEIERTAVDTLRIRDVKLFVLENMDYIVAASRGCIFIYIYNKLDSENDEEKPKISNKIQLMHDKISTDISENIILSPNENWIAASLKSKIIIWNLSLRSIHNVIQTHAGNIKFLRFDESSQSIFSISNEDLIKVWNLNHRSRTKVNYNSFYCFDISEDGKEIVHIDSGKIITLLSSENYEIHAHKNLGDISIRRVRFIKNKKRSVLLLSNDNVLYLFESNDLTILDDRFQKNKRDDIAVSIVAFALAVFYPVQFNLDHLKRILSDGYTLVSHDIFIESNKITLFFESNNIKHSYGELDASSIKDAYLIRTIIIDYNRGIHRVPKLTTSSHYRPCFYHTVKRMTTYAHDSDGDDFEVDYSYQYKKCAVLFFDGGQQVLEVSGTGSDRKIYFSQNEKIYKRNAFSLKQQDDFVCVSKNPEVFLVARGSSTCTEQQLYLCSDNNKTGFVLSGFKYKENQLFYAFHRTQIVWSPFVDAHSGTTYLFTANMQQGLWIWKISYNQEILKPQLIHVLNGRPGLETREMKLKRVSGLEQQNYRLLQQRSAGTSLGRPTDSPSDVILQARNAQVFIPTGRIPYIDERQGLHYITAGEWLIQWVRYPDDNKNKHVWFIVQGLDEENYTVIKEVHFYLNVHKPHFFGLAGRGFHVIHDKAPEDMEATYPKGTLLCTSWSVTKPKIESWLNTLMMSNERPYTLEGRMGYNCVSWCREQIAILGLPLQTEEYPHLINRIVAVPKDYIPVIPIEEPDDAPKCCIM